MKEFAPRSFEDGAQNVTFPVTISPQLKRILSFTCRYMPFFPCDVSKNAATPVLSDGSAMTRVTFAVVPAYWDFISPMWFCAIFMRHTPSKIIISATKISCAFRFLIKYAEHIKSMPGIASGDNL